MAENLECLINREIRMPELPKPTYAFTIQCDVLPIMRLTRWAALAGEFLTEVHTLRQASPEFDRMCKRMLGGVVTPDPMSSSELVAGALWAAESMLEAFTNAHGGDI